MVDNVWSQICCDEGSRSSWKSPAIFIHFWVVNALYPNTFYGSLLNSKFFKVCFSVIFLWTIGLSVMSGIHSVFHTFSSQKNEWREIAVSKASDLQEWNDISSILRLALHALSHQGPNICSIQNTNLALLWILGRMLPASHYHQFPVAENAGIGVRCIWIQTLPPPLTSCMFWGKFLLHFSLFFYLSELSVAKAASCLPFVYRTSQLPFAIWLPS